MKHTRWALYIGCAAVAIVIGVLASWLLNDSNTETGTATQPDAELVHVHGLGYDLRRKILYVATHTGMFELADGAAKATRIGDKHQDTMGFTLIKPNLFLGSGHPDTREELPPHLGDRAGPLFPQHGHHIELSAGKRYIVHIVSY